MRFIRILIAAVLFMGALPSANAVVVVQQEFFSSNITNGSLGALLQGFFDPAKSADINAGLVSFMDIRFAVGFTPTANGTFTSTDLMESFGASAPPAFALPSQAGTNPTAFPPPVSFFNPGSIGFGQTLGGTFDANGLVNTLVLNLGAGNGVFTLQADGTMDAAGIFGALTEADFASGITVTSATVNVVPVPAAVWLFGSALGLLGWMRRRTLATS